MMSMLFGELRSELHKQANMDAQYVFALLCKAYQLDAFCYENTWMPYLESFALPDFEAQQAKDVRIMLDVLPRHARVRISLGDCPLDFDEIQLLKQSVASVSIQNG